MYTLDTFRWSINGVQSGPWHLERASCITSYRGRVALAAIREATSHSNVLGTFTTIITYLVASCVP